MFLLYVKAVLRQFLHEFSPAWESSRPANQIKPQAALICILSCQKQSHFGQGDSHQFTLFMSNAALTPFPKPPNEEENRRFSFIHARRAHQHIQRHTVGKEKM